MFSGGIEIKHWPKVGEENNVTTKPDLQFYICLDEA